MTWSQVPDRHEAASGLRIVIGAETFPPDVNGAARFTHRLAVGLASRGHEVHVMCPAPTGRPSVEEVDGVTVHRFKAFRTPFHPSFRVAWPWPAQKAMAPLLAEIKPDIIHVQSHFLLTRALIWQAEQLRIPLVATNHFMPENILGHMRMPVVLRSLASKLAWWDLTRGFGNAAVVTAPTPRAVQLLMDNGLPQQARAISCGIDLDRYVDRAVSPDDEHRTVLFVGRLDEEKRVHELIRALPLIPAELKVRAEIVGDGSKREALEQLAGQLGIADRVTFRGFISDEELLDAYASCDAFCMPGIAELQSLATMEAMAAGKPVVAADAMALPHLARPGRNGWLYPPGNVPTLAARLTQLFSDDAERERMGKESLEIIGTHGVSTTLATFEEVYAEAMSESRRLTHLADHPRLPEQAGSPRERAERSA
ncbi:glycosyltransferase [Kutzneria sp. NPDC052558]|uniref:glycosyltransferase n=1 Tax=Kutzneria sp. NPDC052558 TaxID=3364121 RepID=UPI0037C9EC9F